jgi:hypothetical protein
MAWVRMRQRCNNSKNAKYNRYGGRGITICDRWEVYENFFEDMGMRPSRNHSLDRIDNDGNYEPGNCRWATASEQRRNQGPRPATSEETKKKISSSVKRVRAGKFWSSRKGVI